MAVVLKSLAGAAALLFVLTGVAFWAAPEFAAAQLGMPLLNDVGRSSQIADFASFFIVAGVCIGLGLSSGNRIWFYPPVMLLSVAIIGRLIAWAVHGAALTLDMIAVEIVVVSMLALLIRSADSGDA
ncbi:hypothetical protein ABWI01_10740 [Oceanicaulis alexandrii]|uniref:hypothetical protein n=1 Tax=Oceanicaulis alexandrii TaxID=153233 RepID=UPI0035CEBB2E